MEIRKKIYLEHHPESYHCSGNCYRQRHRYTKLYLTGRYAQDNIDHHPLFRHPRGAEPGFRDLPPRPYPPPRFQGYRLPFYITRDGGIHRGRSLERIGAHCKNHNRHSVGICYEGGLSAGGIPADTRTLEQKAALLALLRELRAVLPEAIIVGHRDLNPLKGCPCFDAVKEYASL